jgi:CheY-like chemotaxis protein
MKRPTVLCVDDDFDDAVLLRRACRTAQVGFDLQILDHGRKAIDYLSAPERVADRENHPLPDCVLLDLNMPLQNGFELMAWLQSQSGLRRVPVVVFTTSNYPADIEKAYASGAECYLLKPSNYETLVTFVKALNHALMNGHDLCGELQSMSGFQARPFEK